MSDGLKKFVLDVGQCQPDHQAIRRMIESEFDARVESSADAEGAMQVLCEQKVDLVLVNRILDATLHDGLELVQKMQQHESLRRTPIMMISNFESAQQEAIAAGAAPGFGKAHLDEETTRKLLANYLG